MLQNVQCRAWLLLLLLTGGVLYWQLYPHLAELDTTIAFYGFALCFMSWQALEVLVSQLTLWSWLVFLAVIGMVLGAIVNGIHSFYPTPAGTPENEPKSSSTTGLLGKRGHWQGTRYPLIEFVRLPTLARIMMPALPALTLFCHWLLAVSIWGSNLDFLLR